MSLVVPKSDGNGLLRFWERKKHFPRRVVPATRFKAWQRYGMYHQIRTEYSLLVLLCVMLQSDLFCPVWFFEISEEDREQQSKKSMGIEFFVTKTKKLRLACVRLRKEFDDPWPKDDYIDCGPRCFKLPTHYLFVKRHRSYTNKDVWRVIFLPRPTFVMNF